MVFNNFFNNLFYKTHKNINKTANSFNKIFYSFNNLNVVTKLFVIFLILLLLTTVFNTYNNKYEFNLLENYDNNNHNNSNYVKKYNLNIYDEYYSRYYDAIHLNKDRHKLELEHIINLSNKDNNTKILDVGCGTGYSVKLFHDKKYDIVGLDQSKAMISKAQSNYPECEFVVNNILTNNILDYDSFSHILCLGKTFHEIKHKKKFFENCASLLSPNGFIVIHLVDRDKFKPYAISKKSKTLYNSEDYGKIPKERIVKFDKNNEFYSKYKIHKDSYNNDNYDDTATPFASYNEKFTNFKLNKIRENQNHQYMIDTNTVINIAKSKDLKLHKKLDLKSAGHENEYLYVFKKYS